MKNVATLDKIFALSKRRGFVYPAAEIYGGLNGVYDFGPMGVALKDKIKAMWTRDMRTSGKDIVFMDGSILGQEKVWEASGHTANFSDPMVDCTNCKKRYRSDDDGFNIEKPCANCGKTAWTEERAFQLMFETQLGAVSGSSSVAYLRPETAQSIFINFKNVLSTSRVKVPFGIAQIGKAFRNEITPKQFLFRVREFEQMEMEFFCQPDTSKKDFTWWLEKRGNFYKKMGLDQSRVRFREHATNELAHYSSYCTDVEYEFPFGWKELEGIAHRSCYDLSQHIKHSGKELSVFDEAVKESYVPHVIECSVGVDRLFLTLLFDSYREDEVEGESRVYLAIKPSLAPVPAAFLPLMKKQTAAFKPTFEKIRDKFPEVVFDETGSIGKRYRRQDEIGTPLCFTYDYDSDNDLCVTVRNRDTLKQERISIDKIEDYLLKTLAE